jgi:hypothetical protein
MNLLLIALIAAGTAVLLALAVHAVVTTVKGDGYGRRSWQRTPPRSHHADSFDPRSRLA